MGKTHLARATADEARLQSVGLPAPRARFAFEGRAPGRRDPRSAARVIYTSAEQFTSDFVSAMRNGRNEAWGKRYRGPIDLLVVEDIQFLVGRTKTQQELYHTIEHVLDSGGRVLLTGDRAPRDLTGLDERMRALVARGFVAELERPDALVRRHILRAKAAAGGVHLPADCLDLLVDSTGGSVRDIEGLLIQVVTTASLLGKSIDLALTREAIDRKSGASSTLAPRKLEVGEVVRIVAAFFGTRPEALASRSRRRDVLIPRQLAMYLAHRHTEASLTEIGRGLGRDHPSVRNAITRIERQILENAPVRYQVEALSERIDRSLDDREQ
jgi:chromosomal replication initiator protein